MKKIEKETSYLLQKEAGYKKEVKALQGRRIGALKTKHPGYLDRVMFYDAQISIFKKNNTGFKTFIA